MSLLIPSYDGARRIECSQTSTSAEGTTVTASGTTHTKGAWAQLIASTAFDAAGIMVHIGGMATATTNIKGLLDIGIGAAASEVVLIPNLMCGSSGTWVGAMNGGNVYFFPIMIPAGQRVSARLQANTASDTCTCVVWLFEEPIGPSRFIGQRVTAYGANTGTSGGVAHTPGSTNAYATATQIIASTTNPIRFMQVGMDMGTDTTGTSMRGMLRIGLGATPDYLVQHIPWGESTTVESLDNRMTNLLLSMTSFNIPAASDLRLSAMVNGTGEARQWIIYGVD